MIKRLLILTAVLCLTGAANPARAWNENYDALQKYLVRETGERYQELFKGITSLDQWKAERSKIKADILEMLGHDSPWPKAPPTSKVTHRIERPDYILECLVLETAPGLYATANLYIPRHGQAPFPVVVYQSGHSNNGIYGNKTSYKHHGAWFAAHGIACLMLDTIEMGELQVTHHGVYSKHWYDWYSRGYSPIAMELFNARRSLDYLATREQIDSGRIGATGISGGGVATFFLALADERVAAAAEVSGVCSTVGHTVGQLAVLHCDCMYHVNSLGRTFSEIGALVAPRPFLFCNATEDALYPMPYFEQLVDKISGIYSLYGKPDNIGTATAPGGHNDSEAIRLPVYSFFLKEFLGVGEKVTSHGAVDTLPDEQLLCLRDGYPADDRLSRIHKDFMPLAHRTSESPAGVEKESRKKSFRELLHKKVFSFFPEQPAELEPESGGESMRWGRKFREINFNSFDGLRVRGIYSLPVAVPEGKVMPAVLVLEDEPDLAWWGGMTRKEGYRWGDRAVLILETLDIGSRAIDDSLRHQMRRQAMIAGCSFDGMRVFEIIRGIELLRSQPEVDGQKITVAGRGAMAVNGLYAALLDNDIARVVLEDPTGSHLEGPYYLGILTRTDIPEVVGLMEEKVRLLGGAPDAVVEAISNPDAKKIRASLAECLE
jgi:cephalosporin-C deacetylase-like acetyl esterase